MILGGQFVSRINMNLREDKGYTYGARTAFEFRRAPGPFVLQASVQSDATADAMREALARDPRHPRRAAGHRARSSETGRAALTRGYPRNFETADQIARGGRAARAVRSARRLLHDLRARRCWRSTAPDITRVAAASHRSVAPAHRDRRRPREACRSSSAGRRCDLGRRLVRRSR